MKEYQVVIVDDEQLARTLLIDYIGKMPQLKLACSCAGALDAISYIRNNPVDILISDIEMPDINGIDFVKTLKKIPAIIFSTAYSEYAVEGFELNAIDYLLKPFSFSRFVQAINKATEKVDGQAAPAYYESRPATNGKDYISIKADYKIYKVDFDDIIFIEGQSEYVTFHTTSRNITAYYALKNLEKELPESRFIRVHKSYIVSIKHIEYVDSNHLGVAGNKIPIGGTYKDEVLKYFTEK